jgi:hypothetical protein
MAVEPFAKKESCQSRVKPFFAFKFIVRNAYVSMSQCPQDLLLRMSVLRHLLVLLVLVQKTTLAASNSTCRLFGFGSGDVASAENHVAELEPIALALAALSSPLSSDSKRGLKFQF